MTDSRRLPAIVLLVAIGRVLSAAPASNAATFAVNTTPDADDLAPGDGLCGTAEGLCTLHAAVMEANALPGPDSITLPAGIDNLDTGALVVTDDLTITGAGARRSVARMRAHGGVVFVAGPVFFRASGMSIRGGSAVGFGAGGVFNGGGTVELTDVIVTHNRLDSAGGSYAAGGIVNAGGTIRLTNVLIARNRISGFDGGFGWIAGGVMNDGGTLEMTDVTIASIRADRNGFTDLGAAVGGVYNHGGSAQLTNVTLAYNRVVGPGAAGSAGAWLGSSGDTAALVNVTIVRNASAPFGCAAVSGNATLTNATVARNHTAPFHSNLPALCASPLGTITVRNTIVANNRPRNCAQDSVVSLGHNLESGDFCGFAAPGDLHNARPHLLGLHRSGGFGPTVALGRRSPAIDAGDDVVCPATDQRGAPRPMDGDGDGMAHCDIGAYEVQPAP